MEVPAQEVRDTCSFLCLFVLGPSGTGGCCVHIWVVLFAGSTESNASLFLRQPLGTPSTKAWPAIRPSLCPQNIKPTTTLSILYPSQCTQNGCSDEDMAMWLSHLPVSIKLHLTLFPDLCPCHFCPNPLSKVSKWASFSWLVSTQVSYFVLPTWGTIGP